MDYDLRMQLTPVYNLTSRSIKTLRHHFYNSLTGCYYKLLDKEWTQQVSVTFRYVFYNEIYLSNHSHTTATL